MMKWIIIVAVLAYLYFELKFNVETTDQNLNQLAGLPYTLTVKDLLNPSQAIAGVKIRIRVSF